MARKHTAAKPPDRRRGLTLLGRSRPVPAAPEQARLESFANPYPRRKYEVRCECPEFTSLCPITGQPDFGGITIVYLPGRRCLESKALKLYLAAFRNCGIFYEEAVNRILDDVVRACRPRQARVTGVFNPRGGIAITVAAEYPPPRRPGLRSAAGSAPDHTGGHQPARR